MSLSLHTFTFQVDGKDHAEVMAKANKIAEAYWHTPKYKITSVESRELRFISGNTRPVSVEADITTAMAVES